MKSLFEQFGGVYQKENNYLIPNIKLSDKKEKSIGIWGQQHLHFLQQHRRITYINLLTSGNLYEYLSEIDRQAQKRFFQIIQQMKLEYGITEQLKESNSMEWGRRINFVKHQAEEIVFNELIYR